MASWFRIQNPAMALRVVEGRGDHEGLVLGQGVCGSLPDRSRWHVVGPGDHVLVAEVAVAVVVGAICGG